MAGEEGDGTGGGGAANKEAEEKDLELDLMAEQELLRLTRQYRVKRMTRDGLKIEERIMVKLN